MISRRDFVLELGVATVVSRLTRTPERAPMHVGYAAITWGGNDLQAIEDIAAVGFEGIQLRANILTRFDGRASELRDLLARRHLTFVALSSGNLGLEPSREQALIAEHLEHARFLRDAGGLYLQIIDERPRGRPATPEDYRRLGHLLTKLGERTADVGIPVAYHPHMGALGEKPDEVERILDASDPRYVKLLLDVAHYRQGGGDPVEAIRRYHERLALLHIKDVETVRDERGGEGYRFVELGRGRVDLPAVFAALRDVGFQGWGIVELDAVPDNARTPKASALISKRYMDAWLGK
jgi:inosose dehydratase